MRQYVAVIECGSFSGAARRLGVGQPAVSKTIARLEDVLGIRLLLRSTRSTKPTDAGNRFYDGCIAALEAAEAAEHAARDEAYGDAGEIRIAAPELFTKVHVLPKLADFRLDNPRVDFTFTTLRSDTDPVTERLDIAVFRGRPSTPDLVVRKIADIRTALVGSPEVARKWGAIKGPHDLMDAPAVALIENRIPAPWVFDVGGAHVAVAPGKGVDVDSASSALSAALHGHGLWMTAASYIAREKSDKRLCEVMPDHASETPFYLGFPSGRQRPARVDRFAEWLTAQVASDLAEAA